MEIAAASKIRLSLLLWMYMSIFVELNSKLWLNWEMCWNSALFKLPILMSLLWSFKRREYSEMFHQYILIYNYYNGYNKHRGLKIYYVEG